MSYVIDRRLNGKNKSTVNRQRFLRRYREHIKKAVEEAVSRRSITDMEHGEQISIPGRDIDEPVLHHGRGGRQTVVHPGNKEFTAGEHIARPSGGGGGRGGGKASNSGEGMDDFVFQITQEEFLDFMFEDLELPNLVKRHITGTDTFKTVRAGISNDGNPSRINIVRTLRSAHARRIALSGGSRAKLRAALKELSGSSAKSRTTSAISRNSSWKSPSSARASTGCRSSIPSISSTICWSSSPTPPPRR